MTGKPKAIFLQLIEMPRTIHFPGSFPSLLGAVSSSIKFFTAKKKKKEGRKALVPYSRGAPGRGYSGDASLLAAQKIKASPSSVSPCYPLGECPDICTGLRGTEHCPIQSPGAIHLGVTSLTHGSWRFQALSITQYPSAII